METLSTPRPEGKKTRATRRHHNGNRAEQWQADHQPETEGKDGSESLSASPIDREKIDDLRALYQREHADQGIDDFIEGNFPDVTLPEQQQDQLEVRAYVREKLALSDDEYEASFEIQDEAKEAGESAKSPEHVAESVYELDWGKIEDFKFVPGRSVAVERSGGELDGLDTGWRIRKINLGPDGTKTYEVVQPPLEGAADQDTLVIDIPEAELLGAQKKYEDAVRHSIENVFPKDVIDDVTNLYRSRKAEHVRTMSESAAKVKALEDMQLKIREAALATGNGDEMDIDDRDMLETDLKYHLLILSSDVEKSVPSPESIDGKKTTAPEVAAKTSEAGEKQEDKRSILKRISDRMNQAALRAYAMYPDRADAGPNPLNDAERKRRGGNRLLVTGMVAVAAAGILYARTKGFDIDVPTQEAVDALPVDAAVETSIDHSTDALTIDKGEGWNQTFKEMGIPKEEWSTLLDRVGDKLPDEVAYYDQEAGEWRMNMTEDGKMPQEVLDMVHSEWQGEGTPEGAQADSVAAEAPLVEEAPAAEAPQAANTPADIAQSNYQVNNGTGGLMNSATIADSSQVGDAQPGTADVAAGQALEQRAAAEAIEATDKVMDIANSEYIRVDGGSITIDRAMDGAALARELHISQDNAMHLLQSLSMNTELSGAVAENSAGQLEIKPVKITNNNAILAIQTAAGQLRA